MSGYSQVVDAALRVWCSEDGDIWVGFIDAAGDLVSVVSLDADAATKLIEAIDVSRARARLIKESEKGGNHVQ